MLNNTLKYFRFIEIYTASLIASRIGHSFPDLHRDKLQQESKKNWIPPYQVRGRLSQARNDKLLRTDVVMNRKKP